jgi:hypothetical protein
MAESMIEHNHKGNCWDAPYECKRCGNELCDVCHEHDEPRGECSVCTHCPACRAEELLAEDTPYRVKAMTQDKRDPRKDPRVGDVMDVACGRVEVSLIQGKYVHYLLAARSGPPIYRIPMMCKETMQIFRKQMALAEVIHAED